MTHYLCKHSFSGAADVLIDIDVAGDPPQLSADRFDSALFCDLASRLCPEAATLRVFVAGVALEAKIVTGENATVILRRPDGVAMPFECFAVPLAGGLVRVATDTLDTRALCQHIAEHFGETYVADDRPEWHGRNASRQVELNLSGAVFKVKFRRLLEGLTVILEPEVSKK